MWTAPAIELRYQALDEALRVQKIVDVVELASGISPRGLIWTSQNLGTFVDTDLPEIHNEKKAMVMDMLSGEERHNLKWAEVDATSNIYFSQLSANYGIREVAFIHEGLLPYLDHGEKWRVGKNIADVLRKSGGCWITPDIFYKEDHQVFAKLDETTQKVIGAISGLTQRNLSRNAFTDKAEAMIFFKSLGFEVQILRQRDLMTRLSSLESVEVEPKKLEAILNRGTVWVMKLK
jgi:O-methyltransferase involved in polyketide biosynthesis